MTSASPAAAPAPALRAPDIWARILSVLGTALALAAVWDSIDLDPGYLTASLRGAATEQVGTWFVLAAAAVYALYAAARFIAAAVVAAAGAHGRSGTAAKALAAAAVLLFGSALATGNLLGFGFGALIAAMLIRYFALPSATAPVSAA